MSLNRKSCVTGLLVAAWTVTAFVSTTRAATTEVVGQVRDVTLYRGQALVTRTVATDGAKGPMEIVVTNLPEQIVPGSLFVEGGEGVEVRAVRYRSRAVGQEPREEVRKLDEALDETREKIESTMRARETLGKRSAYLDQLESGFVAPAFKFDLARGVLDAAALEKVSLFNFEQRKVLATEQITLEKETKELNKHLALLERKRAELTAGATRAIREAVVFVEKRDEDKRSLRLSYLVSDCGWSPVYVFRAAKDRKELALECNALIQQVSGEDWSGVNLVLSTASPALAASGPGLAPFAVNLSREPGRWANANVDVAGAMQSIKLGKKQAIDQQQQAVGFSDSVRAGWALNITANDLQGLELAARKDVWGGLQLEKSPTGEEPSLSYQLSAPVSLASRADQQMVRILETALQGTFYHVATPLLTSFVFREVELTNSSREDLLAGPVTVYLDGRFVGRSEIPTVARGQTFVVGFGGDPQLRARRELADRTELLQGGNRELSLKYRLVIENYKSEAVPLRVFDRLPYSDRPNDIRIKLGDLKDPLSSDPFYARRERPKNILRWDLTAPPAATGDKVRIIEYGYTLDFDRNFVLRPLGESAAPTEQPAASVPPDYERLQRERAVK
jgi:hypothetical protein